MRRVYVLGLVAAAGYLLADRWDELRDLARGAQWLPLVGVLVLGLLSLLQSAWFWASCLRALGAPTSTAEALDASVRSLPARYLPGSVWYALGRAALLAQRGTSKLALGATATLETAMSFAVAVALGLALTLVAGVGADATPWLVVAAVAMALAASPPAINAVLGLVARRRGSPVRTLDWRSWSGLVGQMVLFWMSSAAAFALYLHAFPEVDVASAPEVAGAFLLAWAAGFLAVFAPQGAGVFELAVAGLLTGEPVGGLALVVAGHRALTVVRDVVALAVHAALSRRTSSRNPTT